MARRARISWTEKANEDAEKVRRRIREHSSEKTAKSFVGRIFASVKNLRDFPEMGSIVEELNDTNIRETYVGSYRVLYRYEPPYVRILAIHNGAQLLDKHDFGSE